VLADLQRVAHRTGSPALIGRMDRLLVHRCLDGIVAGTAAPAVLPMRSEPVREAARERITDLLSTPFPEPGGPGRGGARGWTPPERAVELLRWARRHKAIVWTVAAALLVCAYAPAVSLGFVMRAKNEAQAALKRLEQSQIRVAGLVVNDLDPQREGLGEYHYYQYDYQGKA
jgi:hypothetical protein